MCNRPSDRENSPVGKHERIRDWVFEYALDKGPRVTLVMVGTLETFRFCRLSWILTVEGNRSARSIRALAILFSCSDIQKILVVPGASGTCMTSSVSPDVQAKPIRMYRPQTSTYHEVTRSSHDERHDGVEDEAEKV